MAALILPLSLLALVTWLSWQAAWRNAYADMERLSATAAEYGQRSFETYNFAAARVNERLRGMSDADITANEAALHRDVTAMLADLTHVALSFVLDRDGLPLLSTSLHPVPRDVSLADRDYFQEMLGPDAPDVFVSRTFLGRFDGVLLFSVARPRVNTGNPGRAGRFDGLVMVSIKPGVLAEGLRHLLEEPTDRMLLMREDGSVLSTTSTSLDANVPLPQLDSSSPFHGFAQRSADKAIYVSRTVIPGTSSLLAMHRIKGFPLYAVSIRPRSQIVALWWHDTRVQVLFGLFATAALFLFSLRVAQDQRALAGANTLLNQTNALKANRLDRAKRFGLIGTFEFDVATGVSKRSPEYMSVHGMPAFATDETHADWARRLHPDDRARAEGAILSALADPAVTEYAQTYRIIHPDGAVRWIAARGEITRAPDGRATMLLGAHVDVTPLRTTELALAESDARLRLAQESLGIGSWEWLPQARRLTCSGRMLALLGVFAEPAASDARDLRLAEVLARVHPQDRAGLRDQIRAAAAQGGFRAELRILAPGVTGDGSASDNAAGGRRGAGRGEAGNGPRWIAVRATLFAARPARAARLMGIAYDVSDRKRAEDLTHLMAREVEHRAKNTLSLISGLLRMTKADSAGQLAKVMEGRIRALGSTMSLMGKGGWTGASIDALVTEGLAPFVSGAFAQIVQMSGPPVQVSVDAAQPFSMAIHELATNAAKYGALSVATGRVRIDWTETQGRVVLRWHETGGPPVTEAPAQAGFGSKLIKMLFEGQLGGSIDREWTREGLICTLSFPMRA